MGSGFKMGIIEATILALGSMVEARCPCEDQKVDDVSSCGAQHDDNGNSDEVVCCGSAKAEGICESETSSLQVSVCPEPLGTLRIDPRHPFQNQTWACYFSYCDFYKCSRLLKGSEDCLIFRKYFETLCPKSWTEHWDELKDKDSFPGPI